MLDIKFIRENSGKVKKAIELKSIKFDLDAFLSLDKELLRLKSNEQELLTKRKSHSKKIPQASPEERVALITEGKKIGDQIDEVKPKLTQLQREFDHLMLLLPQIPHESAPIGKDETENVEIKKVGEIPQFDFTPKDHVELLDLQGWAEFEKIAKVCGSRSYSLRDELVLVEMAMHRMAMEKLRAKGFTLISAPAFAREEALVGTGHFPSGKDQVYHLPEDNLYLSGTSEVQVNSLHAGDILKEEDLPILYAGFSPCFRREAGSYGKDVRGLIRVHQFMKVEQYVICKNDPEESMKWHAKLLETSEEIVRELELPYRVIECCTGDMGTGKVKMFDIEAWVPSEKKYRETHSCSALYDWQSRRTNTRYKEKEGKPQFVHTLNNTAIATPRILVPFLENHQNADGTVNIPMALRPFLGGIEKIGKKVF